ncbi:N-acetylmannosamine-6-phosphate 2-epimerase [Bacillus sp. Marseille-Q1617]|uniref:N-acetylmannosamine-6-phosphate 2-epimerase n=1 Tax=Bacillus sp. Marseille-Q1617 TaxID=2736887 RepID=UPI00158995ED|nr:N-acetylmannosamine-6-phosphate 2-epimerase [Bacillus sp. Marseille-Q1617]
MKKEEFLDLVKHQLIVSSQAYPGDPLYGSDMMAKMSVAAKEGGAAAIRANGKEDIIAIKKAANLPVIGIIKQDYDDSDIYITPTLKEVNELLEAGAEVIALDATQRKRPGGVTLEELIRYVRNRSDCLIMGDISTAAEGAAAMEAGCDFISTTLSGYTPYSRQSGEVDIDLIKDLSKEFTVIAEGKIHTPEQAAEAFTHGAHAVVVGTAITRPEVITSRFVAEIKEGSGTKKA